MVVIMLLSRRTVGGVLGINALKLKGLNITGQSLVSHPHVDEKNSVETFSWIIGIEYLNNK